MVDFIFESGIFDDYLNDLCDNGNGTFRCIPDSAGGGPFAVHANPGTPLIPGRMVNRANAGFLPQVSLRAISPRVPETETDFSQNLFILQSHLLDRYRSTGKMDEILTVLALALGYEAGNGSKMTGNKRDSDRLPSIQLRALFEEIRLANTRHSREILLLIEELRRLTADGI